MTVDRDRLSRACDLSVQYLLAQRNVAGHWVGELSTSALSTATAVMALQQVETRAASVSRSVMSLIERGSAWLLAHQNADGGWGDTSKSVSNISTTMLCHATLVATRPDSDASITTLTRGEIVTREQAISKAADYIAKAGGVPALIRRYGRDQTFSVPILTHCALAGLVPWSQVPRLPFELSCIPASWYAAARFPVVSYALPALIAIGQVRHFHGKTWNPITRFLRWLARDRSLAVLQKIQPPHGGFLEAAPLTSFVCMSLAGMGLIDHPVVQRGIDFLVKSVRPDGSWPIDTNLATWVTTLAVNALGEDLPEPGREPILKWLLDQQYKVTHPYTNAAPGGWAWTDLPGGVPDADDTPGAILAIATLQRASDVSRGCSSDVVHHGGTEARRENADPSHSTGHPEAVSGTALAAGSEAHHRPEEPAASAVPLNPSTPCLRASVVNPAVDLSVENAIRWLINLQNRDGGFPTFCRGWGTLPFDRSSPDITAHCLRALNEWQRVTPSEWEDGLIDSGVIPAPDLWVTLIRPMNLGFAFLERVQRPNGSWLPLWFGNQHVPKDENPVYGTSRVLRAFRDCDRWNDHARRGAAWLRSIQNPDGGWGGDAGSAVDCGGDGSRARRPARLSGKRGRQACLPH